MQDTENNNDESELIRLLLKRQSELNSLLEVTRAINKNTSTQVLISMLEVILKSYLNVGKLRFMIEKFGTYYCVSKYGGDFESNTALYKSSMKLNKFKLPANISSHADAILSSYDYFIPIYHKNKLLAFALIGDFYTSGEMLNNDLNFIQTIMNVIVVALENKKLFKERIEAERFQREMELAVEVQNMLIPIRLHVETGVEIGARYLPHQNIGGDYFDFIRLNDKEFMWCIADVSGKGISAALLMANFQASLRAWATVEDDLTNIVERLNRIVIKITKGEKFITLFLAKYNEETRRLNFINAGHNPSLLYANGEAVELKLGTTMIGAFDELPFINQGELDIEPGSLILNYTDGLLDYEPADTEVWNEDVLMDFLIQNGDLSPDKFNQVLLNELHSKVKSKQIDDITLLTLRIF
ncbi:sigma-B regulation protein RsbU (phosphoserine phosphatase) [Mucilaginibacter gracilis]|uniref:Sigma-B regulation protein RsbU (Phosphoserine phosphatase) n=1 Tax=Mucilaginibacter gracilis TaxID=423350 RepID=A0A495IXU6_9SPHI|nr:PP2C family protein-serine/threonine phosphatase [Mucilaginibacter gracilis]RKR81526.1 sigma-B regulation protein RsbU (phosphoserine phosphatase) [Mucilaginibacter gracilis]